METVERARKGVLHDGLKKVARRASVSLKPHQLADLDVGPALPKDLTGVLHPGDLFRLRSVKFPGFELGITSTKIRREYCYLGLRKYNEAIGVPAGGAEWCMEVCFSVTPQSLTNTINETMQRAIEIFTIPKLSSKHYPGGAGIVDSEAEKTRGQRNA